MAKSTKALLTGRIQMCKTNPSVAHIGLATHGRSNGEDELGMDVSKRQDAGMIKLRSCAARPVRTQNRTRPHG